MSAGDKIVQMRTAIRRMTPYLDHRSDCLIRGPVKRCTCEYAIVLHQAQWLAGAHPGHTGHTPRTLEMGKL